MPFPFGTWTSRSSILTRSSSVLIRAPLRVQRSGSGTGCCAGACSYEHLEAVRVVHVARREDPFERRLAVERTAAAVDVRDELAAPLLQVAVDRVHGELAER